ncbi:MAG TPA: carbamate kinase [Candidatus Polarisedimenticolaceae bacterium]|nr:carbamate kinase [Candidatus Polarisedimenticolaceae bacterium]
MAEPAGKPIVLVALGGHTFVQPGQRGAIDEQRENAAHIARALMTLVEKEYHLVLTHGNGPQVGELAEAMPAVPFDALVAMTEGSLGYVLQQSLLNELRRREVRRYVVTVVTQVLVGDADSASRIPVKPVGPFLSAAEARERSRTLGWTMKEEPGRGWRRLVPSPRPVRVIQRHMIREAARSGHIVIACGGGGVPITTGPERAYLGVEAVIDKDLTSSVLAADIGAALLVILTSVPQVLVNAGTPAERALGAVTLQEIESLHAEGHFPAGSMGPKIEAVMHYLKHGGRRALITDPESLRQAIEGRAGTHIVGRI